VVWLTTKNPFFNLCDMSTPRYKNPKMKMQQLDNLSKAFTFMEAEGIKLVNISNLDVWDGNQMLICGLIWTIIYEFQLSKMSSGKKNPQEALMEWIQSKIPEEGESVQRRCTSAK
jgi:hypothetical protein